MDGWTFPRDLTKVPSDAVTLRARIAGGLLIHGVAVTPSVPERIAARAERRARWRPWRRPAEDAAIIIEIDGERGGSEIRVAQSGTQLSVESVEPTRLGRS